MIKISELTKEQYTAGEVAKLLGVHVKTVQVWDRTGVLPFSRTHTNRRILPKDKMIELLDSRGLLYKDEKDKKYNEMLHSLAYSNFSEFIKRACFKHNIHLSLVSPAYTSIIGKEKYSEVKKLNVHTAASYIIGRRALNFIDNRPV